MATDRSFIDYVLEQVDLGARLRCGRLFGEYALYLDDKVVAFACDNSLFVKPTAAVEQLAPGLPWRPPYKMAKPHPVADELLDEGDALRRLLRAVADELPAPKPKPAGKKAAAKKPAKKSPARPVR